MKGYNTVDLITPNGNFISVFNYLRTHYLKIQTVV